MARTMVRYELFIDPPGEEPWDTMGTSYPTKAQAMKDLKTYLPAYPNVYIARVVYTRVRSTVTKKGR